MIYKKSSEHINSGGFWGYTFMLLQIYDKILPLSIIIRWTNLLNLSAVNLLSWLRNFCSSSHLKPVFFFLQIKHKHSNNPNVLLSWKYMRGGCATFSLCYYHSRGRDQQQWIVKSFLSPSVTCRRLVVSSGYSGFLHQKTDFFIIIFTALIWPWLLLRR